MLRLRTAIFALVLLLLSFLLYLKLRAPSPLERFPAPPSLELAAPDFSLAKLAVEGQILDAEGRGLVDAWISIVGDKKVVSAFCGPDGRFRAEGLPPGSFDLTAAARGFRPGSATVKSGGGPITLQLEPLGRFGRGPNPEPTPAASESYNARLVRKGGPALGFAAALLPLDAAAPPEVRRAPIDSEGFFQFQALPPGSYRLLVLSEERSHDLLYAFGEWQIEIGPGKKPPGSVEVSSMEVTGICLAPPLPDVLPAPDPFPFPGAVVHLRLLRPDGRTAEAGWMDTDAKGRFRFANLPEGDYELLVLATGFERYAQRIEKAPGSTVDLRLLLERKRR